MDEATACRILDTVFAEAGWPPHKRPVVARDRNRQLEMNDGTFWEPIVGDEDDLRGQCLDWIEACTGEGE